MPSKTPPYQTPPRKRPKATTPPPPQTSGHQPVGLGCKMPAHKRGGKSCGEKSLKEINVTGGGGTSAWGGTAKPERLVAWKGNRTEDDKIGERKEGWDQSGRAFSSESKKEKIHGRALEYQAGLHDEVKTRFASYAVIKRF